MINYSFSTVLMTILFCNVIVVILYMVFQSKKILPEFGLKLTGFFLCLVILRLLLPIEIPALSHNIYFPSGLSRMIALFRQPRFRNSTISYIRFCLNVGDNEDLMKRAFPNEEERSVYHAWANEVRALWTPEINDDGESKFKYDYKIKEAV